MKNPCKIVFFGDSITKAYAPKIEMTLQTEYPEISLTTINSGISGETTRDGLVRMQQALDEKPDVVVIGFGMNDWRKGVSKKEYKKNLLQMLDAFEKIGARVIINTVSPSYNFQKREYNKQVDDYSESVREIAYEKRIKIADVNALWKRELRSPRKGLRDDIHPNSIGYNIICKCLMWIIPRKNTTVLWQYNGREAKCNYRCPYCYYLGLHNSNDRFTGYIDQWHERYLELFRNQHLVFYLAFGEPTIGEKFFDILKMVGDEPNWELRMTSNISTFLEKIVKQRAATEGRLHINASFHPSMIKRESFLKKLFFLKDNGIEASVVYVAYPEYFSHFVDDLHFFSKNGFVVHIRRFQGKYKRKTYPWSYADQEKILLSKFSDDGTIKYMLNQQVHKNELTFSGLHFFIVDNAGNIGYDSNAFSPYTKLRNIFGNIHTGNFKPTLLPTPYPGRFEATVDGVANLVTANYKELEGNNVLAFARQGGVYKDENGVVIYSNESKDFNDPKIRAEYNFPPRGLQDYMAILRYAQKPLIRQSAYNAFHPIAKNMTKISPAFIKLGKNILKL